MSEALLSLTPQDLARIARRPLPTPAQSAAIGAPPVPAIVEAGAGSGKTETMAARVVWLVVTGRVAADRVLGLTFTRKAAAELQARIRSRLVTTRAALHREHLLDASTTGPEAGGEPTVLTYHAYAARLLVEHAALAGVEPSSRLVGDAVCWQLAHAVVHEADGPLEELDLAPSTVVDVVLRLAAELSEHVVSAETLTRHTQALVDRMLSLPRLPSGRARGPEPVLGPGAPYAQTLAFLQRQQARLALTTLVAEYVRRKRSLGLLDHGDQVCLAAGIARDHPAVGAAERTRYHAVLLDEYQDTSHAQDLLLRSLFGRGHPVTAVGDPVQAIYGWRGASAGAMERFRRDYATGDVTPRRFRLATSFRNASSILTVANDLSHGLRAADDVLDSGTGDAGDVRCGLFSTIAEEAGWIATEARHLVDGGVAPGEISVLVRKRILLGRIARALGEVGLPVVSSDLGGLLDQPEVADVVAVLRCLVDPDAGPAATRLLAGPRWRLGARDLLELGSRARELDTARGAADLEVAPLPAPRGHLAPSLIEAIDHPGDASRYSPAATSRLRRLRGELRHLRAFVEEPLPDLVGRVIATTGWDVEVQVLPGRTAQSARAHLDRLVAVAADFSEWQRRTSLVAFLDYLDAAAERESGLAPGVVGGGTREGDPGGAVQLGTVHAAKGLEWTAVFVAGMTKDVFPDGQPSSTWLTDPGSLPVDLRGDAPDLPRWRGGAAASQQDVRDALTAHRDEWRDHDLLEERRLGYVAVTRARRFLRCSGSWWTEGVTRPRGPSPLLTEIRATCEAGAGRVAAWAEEPQPGANPLRSDPRTLPWPADPLGGRRPGTQAGADLVRGELERRLVRADAAAADPVEPGAVEPGAVGSDTVGPGAVGPTGVGTDDDPWSAAVAQVLHERRERERRTGGPLDVPLPSHLSVSDLVSLSRDRTGLARRLRVHVPRPPTPEVSRGSAFHAWLEARFATAHPLDFDELPFDEIPVTADGDDLDDLVGAFLASRWADRVPVAVEVPFDTVLAGMPVRGRIDAVFDEGGGHFLVVDWKTGREPDVDGADAALIQLAVYRQAWAELAGVPPERVAAAFHYVRRCRTVHAPAGLGTDAVEALLRDVPTVSPV